jgi:hypothetical protein
VISSPERTRKFGSLLDYSQTQNITPSSYKIRPLNIITNSSPP